MRKEGKKNKNKIVYKILSIIAVFLMIMGINIHSISAAENESYDYKYVDNYEFGDSKKAVIFKFRHLPDRPSERVRSETAETHLLCGQHFCVPAPSLREEALLPRCGVLPLLYRKRGPVRQRDHHDRPYRPADPREQDHD